MGSSFSSFWGLRVFGCSGLRFIGLCFRDTQEKLGSNRNGGMERYFPESYSGKLPFHSLPVPEFPEFLVEWAEWKAPTRFHRWRTHGKNWYLVMKTRRFRINNFLVTSDLGEFVRFYRVLKIFFILQGVCFIFLVQF